MKKKLKTNLVTMAFYRYRSHWCAEEITKENAHEHYGSPTRKVRLAGGGKSWCALCGGKGWIQTHKLLSSDPVKFAKGAKEDCIFCSGKVAHKGIKWK